MKWWSYGGLAIVRTRSVWTWRWSTIVTLTGCGVLIVGLWRMAVLRVLQLTENASTYIVLAAMGTLRMVLSLKACWPEWFPRLSRLGHGTEIAMKRSRYALSSATGEL